ncbi:helix-turn-helix domain-containing protein [Halomarina halobia]|uniref:Helix-turn-helix domain-containing protein n=1 Tax=Halomarina halobia TaxID=3033386 RepID=A0ABD6AFT5_9EURY
MSFDIDAIRELDGEPVGRYGLTEEQYEALTEAAKQGYFEVPRDIQLGKLADELSISHQALSERIRRAMLALVGDTLLIGPESDE